MDERPKSTYKAVPTAVLASSLSLVPGYFPKSETKQQKNTEQLPNINSKKYKPLSPNTMNKSILAFQESIRKTPHRQFPKAATTSKKNWNSSVKFNKSETKTAKTKQQSHAARKVLDFSRSSKIVNNAARKTISSNIETSKSQKPDYRKTFQIPGSSNVKIPGVGVLPKTPPISNKTNKENKPPNSTLKPPNIVHHIATPKSILRKRTAYNISDTPASSITKCSDSSFLMLEKEINATEEKQITSVDESLLDFKEYRRVPGLNISNKADESICADTTIMSFDKENTNTVQCDESIGSLCDKLQKTSITCVDNDLTRLKEKLEKCYNLYVKIIGDATKRREECLNYLQVVDALMKPDCDTNVDRKDINAVPIKQKCKIASPTFKIHRKITFRPSQSPRLNSVIKHHKALDAYLTIKKDMTFLNTPKTNKKIDSLDTPARVSKNLQKQLDKLYDDFSD